MSNLKPHKWMIFSKGSHIVEFKCAECGEETCAGLDIDYEAPACAGKSGPAIEEAKKIIQAAQKFKHDFDMDATPEKEWLAKYGGEE